MQDEDAIDEPSFVVPGARTGRRSLKRQAHPSPAQASPSEPLPQALAGVPVKRAAHSGGGSSLRPISHPLSLSYLQDRGDVPSEAFPRHRRPARSSPGLSSEGEEERFRARPPVNNAKWTAEEDEALRKAVDVLGTDDWDAIAASLGNARSAKTLRARWNRYIKSRRTKGAWSAEEDRQLYEEVVKAGGPVDLQWSLIAMKLASRDGKQCRDRWYNHLDPAIRRGPWSEEEDDQLFLLHQQIGNRWADIAKLMPGRTENMVKNRYHSRARAKWAARRGGLVDRLSSSGMSPAQIAEHLGTHLPTAPPPPQPLPPADSLENPPWGLGYRGSAKSAANRRGANGDDTPPIPRRTRRATAQKGARRRRGSGGQRLMEDDDEEDDEWDYGDEEDDDDEEGEEGGERGGEGGSDSDFRDGDGSHHRRGRGKGGRSGKGGGKQNGSLPSTVSQVAAAAAAVTEASTGGKGAKGAKGAKGGKGGKGALAPELQSWAIETASDLARRQRDGELPDPFQGIPRALVPRVAQAVPHASPWQSLSASPPLVALMAQLLAQAHFQRVTPRAGGDNAGGGASPPSTAGSRARTRSSSRESPLSGGDPGLPPAPGDAAGEVAVAAYVRACAEVVAGIAVRVLPALTGAMGVPPPVGDGRGGKGGKGNEGSGKRGKEGATTAAAPLPQGWQAPPLPPQTPESSPIARARPHGSAGGPLPSTSPPSVSPHGLPLIDWTRETWGPPSEPSLQHSRQERGGPAAAGGTGQGHRRRRRRRSADLAAAEEAEGEDFQQTSAAALLRRDDDDAVDGREEEPVEVRARAPGHYHALLATPGPPDRHGDARPPHSPLLSPASMPFASPPLSSSLGAPWEHDLGLRWTLDMESEHGPSAPGSEGPMAPASDTSAPSLRRTAGAMPTPAEPPALPDWSAHTGLLGSPEEREAPFLSWESPGRRVRGGRHQNVPSSEDEHLPSPGELTPTSARMWESLQGAGVEPGDKEEGGDEEAQRGGVGTTFVSPSSSASKQMAVGLSHPPVPASLLLPARGADSPSFMQQVQRLSLATPIHGMESEENSPAIPRPGIAQEAEEGGEGEGGEEGEGGGFALRIDTEMAEPAVRGRQAAEPQRRGPQSSLPSAPSLPSMSHGSATRSPAASAQAGRALFPAAQPTPSGDGEGARQWWEVSPDPSPSAAASILARAERQAKRRHTDGAGDGGEVGEEDWRVLMGAGVPASWSGGPLSTTSAHSGAGHAHFFREEKGD